MILHARVLSTHPCKANRTDITLKINGGTFTTTQRRHVKDVKEGDYVEFVVLQSIIRKVAETLPKRVLDTNTKIAIHALVSAAHNTKKETK
jgi:hypothetical protein